MKSGMLSDVELLADGLAFPEGPIACGDGSVLVVEITGGRLTRVEPGGSTSVVAELGGGPNGAAVGPDGAIYVCNNGGIGGGGRSAAGIQRIDPASGAWDWVYTECEGIALTAPNDLVFDTTGGFWFTDLRGGRICYGLADGSSVTAQALATTPNGIGIGPDGSTLYWAQTTTRQILRRRIASPGVLVPSVGHDTRALIRSGDVDQFTVLVGLPGSMELDSLAIDSSGAVCVATLIEGGITEVPAERAPRRAPDDDLDDVTHWTLPDHLADGVVTNICFGGPDLTTAYLTCAQHGRLVRCSWHRPGLALAYGS